MASVDIWLFNKLIDVVLVRQMLYMGQKLFDLRSYDHLEVDS